MTHRACIPASRLQSFQDFIMTELSREIFQASFVSLSFHFASILSCLHLLISSFIRFVQESAVVASDRVDLQQRIRTGRNNKHLRGMLYLSFPISDVSAFALGPTYNKEFHKNVPQTYLNLFNLQQGLS